MSHTNDRIHAALAFPLFHALMGRRARRFGLGMEIPSGPLAFRSDEEPIPLDPDEQMLLVAAATGVSGWSFGVPFGPRTPGAHAEFTVRFTGRTAPTAAGIGTPALFFTDDDGCHCTLTRDLRPALVRALDGGGMDAEEGLARIVRVCRENTRKISGDRLDLPSAPPHVLPPNLWWANRPGSTLFMPVGDASEECLGLMALMVRHGVTIVDEATGEPAGRLEPFFRSGLLDPARRLPLAELLADVHECLCLELAFMGHNIVLAMQALGIGGLYFNGMDPMSVLGARAGDGIRGLGFRFTEDARWITPNVVGLEGVYEGMCPPFHADMEAAVHAFVARKFGPGGTYDPELPGPWRDTGEVRRSVDPYTDEFTDCLAELARYVHARHGKFPGTRSTITLPGFVQAHYLDLDFYRRHYAEDAFLETHMAQEARRRGT